MQSSGPFTIGHTADPFVEPPRELAPAETLENQQRAPDRPATIETSRAPLVSTWQRIGIGCSLCAGTIFFLHFVHQHYPIQHWLFWIYLQCWAASALFCLSCVTTGHAVVTRILGRTLPLTEQLVFSFAVGAVCFFFCLFLCGIAGGLHPVLFWVVPGSFFALGGRPTFHFWFRAFRRLRRRGTHVFNLESPWAVLACAFGAVSLLLLYFPTLSPHNVSYDARWYHIPIAEHYVAMGAVRPFSEGWFLGAYPHMASYFFAWALLMPKSSLFVRLELIAHLEFAFFLVSVLSVVPIVRRLLPGTRATWTWCATFLFSGLFAYDSALHSGADHIAAAFSGPLFLAFLGCLRRPRANFSIIFALMAAAIINVKLSAIIAVTLPVLALAGYWIYRGLRGPGRRTRLSALSNLGQALTVGLLASAPYWLKNWIFYGDPLYPKLARYVSAHPVTKDYQVPLDNWFYSDQFHASHDWSGALQSLIATVDFSFVPHDWSISPAPAPLFGSLMTLLMLAVPFLGVQKRLWLLLCSIHVGIFAWFQIHHFERYLQTILPWMAGATATVLILIWRSGWLLRPPLMLMVCVQVIWGSDAYFKAHAMTDSPLESARRLLAAGREGRYEDRFSIPNGYADLAKELPEHAKVLVHEQHIHWGLERASVSDWQGTQGGISYVRRGTLGGVYQLLHSLDVTHLSWQPKLSRGHDTLGSDLLFFQFSTYLTKNRHLQSGLMIAEMPEQLPLESFEPQRALLLTCNQTYQTGIYPVSSLTKSDFDPDRVYPEPSIKFQTTPTPPQMGPLTRTVDYVVLENRCHSRLRPRVFSQGLRHLAKRGDWTLYSRPPHPG